MPFYYIQVSPPFSNDPNGATSLEDIFDALYQIKNNLLILLSILGTIISIAFFNFAGISVTKEISATSRMVLDSVSHSKFLINSKSMKKNVQHDLLLQVRTMVIWVFSLAIGWQHFQGLQLAGFIALLFGMCLYNDVLITQAYRRTRDAYVSRRYGNIVNETNVIVNRPADDTENP